MSSVGVGKGLLEVGKFAVYVSLPIGMMYFFAKDPKNLQKVMGKIISGGLPIDVIHFPERKLNVTESPVKHQYVVYPPESLRPLTPEERREMRLEPLE